MRPRISTRVGCLAVLFVLVLFILAAGTRPVPPLQQWTLPSGKVLALQGVTAGRGKQRIVLGTPLQRWLARLVPSHAGDFGARVLNDGVVPNGEPPDKLVFWLTDNQTPSPESYIQPLALLADHGCAAPEWFGGAWPSGSGQAQDVQFSVFPRRTGYLHLRMGSPGHVIECTVPNPAPGPYPQWTPAPVPAIQRNGTLTVKLERRRVADPRQLSDR